MCQYRYYYYGGCRHQETVLYSFCANAKPSTAQNEQRLPHCAAAPELPTSSTSRGHEGSADALEHAAPPRESSSIHATSSEHPSHNSAAQQTSSSGLLSSSPVPGSYTSLQTPSSGSTAYFTQHSSEQRPLNPAMAGLAPFTNSNLRQLMTGKSMRMAALVGVPDLQDLHNNMSDHKPSPGCQPDLAAEQSSALLETKISHAPAAIKASRRENSEAVLETFETLAADIDAMKDEVERMKEEAARELEQHQHEEVSSDRRSSAPQSPTKSKMPAPVSRSAAATLQMEHERNQSNQSAVPLPKSHSRGPSPSPMEFPELGNATSERCTKDEKDEAGSRKLSYANMATTGMMEAISQRYSTPTTYSGSTGTSTCHTRGGLPSSIATASETSGTVASADSDVFTTGTQHTAYTSDVFSPRTALAGRSDSTPTSSKYTPGGSNGQSLKNSPRFAQPTMASNIRTGETLRKDSVVSVTPDGSPTKSIRTITQRNVKRPSLPGGWLGSPVQQILGSSSCADLASDHDPQQRHEDHTDPASPVPTQIVPVQPLRKKTSTYMSPTKATAQRSIMTVGQESPKRTSPRKALPRLTTAVSPTKNLASPDSPLFSARSTVSSASETIITKFNAKRTRAGRGLHLISKATGLVPVNMRNPGAAYSRSSSDIRRRMTIENNVADALAGYAQASNRPTVANTTKVRRESTGSLLNPIRARLNNLGLLSEKSQGYAADDERSALCPRIIVLQPAPELLVQTPVNVTRDESKSSDQRRAEVVPPHRKHRTDRTTVMSDTSRSSSVVVITANKALPMQTPAPSLRATAQVFTPMSMSSITAIGGKSTQANPTGNQWHCSSPEQRANMLSAQESRPAAYVGSPLGNQRPWSESMVAPPGLAAVPPTHATMSSGSIPTSVQAGQVLRPNFIPEINSLQWTMQDINGQESIINFGRAAAPPVVAPHTPIFSPTSDDTSPRHTPGMSPWTIGASIPRASYGWRGGDGREIRFVRYGPEAERESNPQLNPNYKGQTPSGNRERGPRMIGLEDEDGANDVPLAPRSRQQWAALMGYPKVPCGNVEVMHAVEQLPMPTTPKGAGYCGSCVE